MYVYSARCDVLQELHEQCPRIKTGDFKCKKGNLFVRRRLFRPEGAGKMREKPTNPAEKQTKAFAYNQVLFQHYKRDFGQNKQRK